MPEEQPSLRTAGPALLVVALWIAASAGTALDSFRGPSGAWTPDGILKAIACAGLVSTLIVVFGRGPFRDLVRDLTARAPGEHAGDLCAAWRAEPAKCDTELVGALGRVMPDLRRLLDAEYADVQRRRDTAERELGAAVRDLRDDMAARAQDDAKPLLELTRNVSALTQQVGVVAQTVGELRDDHKDLAKSVSDTREELAAYAGDNRRHHRRRASDRDGRPAA